MNLIQVLLKLMVVFGGRNSTSAEISSILAVIVNLANVLMDELHVREKRAGKGQDVPSPFTPGNWDVISNVGSELTAPVTAKVKRSRKIKAARLLS